MAQRQIYSSHRQTAKALSYNTGVANGRIQCTTLTDAHRHITNEYRTRRILIKHKKIDGAFIASDLADVAYGYTATVLVAYTYRDRCTRSHL